VILVVVVPPEEEGRRLESIVGDGLAAHLGRPVPRSVVRRIVMAGAVRLQGRPLRRPGLPMQPGRRIEIALDPRRLDARERDTPFTLTAREVLFRDACLLAVAKPPGLSSVPTADPSRPSLVRAVEEWLSTLGESTYLGVHQRLDRGTSGVVLFARDERANAGLAAAFQAHRVEKTYAALTSRPRRAVPDRFEVDLPVGGKPAQTRFSVVERLPGGLRVEACPRTGRKHQVRVHLAEAGIPILGDTRYGGAAAAPRPMLHAARLSLLHPVSGAPLGIECPLPADFRTALMTLGERASRRR